jgi:cell wall-associated NlpC family hydrolase
MKKSLLSVALIGGLAVTGLGTHQAQAASSTSVVSLAEQGVGSAYSWGQNDCSGFTMRVFSRLGVQLPHSAAGQAGYGSAVNRSDLKPGDLVFFNTSGSGISHVGIYVGNNRMISAETEKTGVRETQIFGGGASSYWEPRFVTARRITTGNQPAPQQSSNGTQPKESTTAPQSSSTQSASDSQTQSSSSTEQASTSVQTQSTSSDQALTNDDQTKSTSNTTSDVAKSNDSNPVANSSDGTSSSQTINSGVYIVQTGDTLWAISNKSGISVQKIQQINKLEDTLIRPGQKINLQDPSERYTIKSGDSLWSIAKENGTTVEQLMKTNNLSSDQIYPDDKLTVSETK